MVDEVGEKENVGEEGQPQDPGHLARGQARLQAGAITERLAQLRKLALQPPA